MTWPCTGSLYVGSHVSQYGCVSLSQEGGGPHVVFTATIEAGDTASLKDGGAGELVDAACMVVGIVSRLASTRSPVPVAADRLQQVMRTVLDVLDAGTSEEVLAATFQQRFGTPLPHDKATPSSDDACFPNADTGRSPGEGSSTPPPASGAIDGSTVCPSPHAVSILTGLYAPCMCLCRHILSRSNCRLRKLRTKIYPSPATLPGRRPPHLPEYQLVRWALIRPPSYVDRMTGLPAWPSLLGRDPEWSLHPAPPAHSVAHLSLTAVR